MPTPKSRTILIIEDDADVREMMQISLESEGYSVVIADNRAAAVVLLTVNGVPDIIILDWHMPGMSVPTFLDELLKITPKLPRIILTSAGCQADNVAKTFGIPEVLRKPFERRRLLEQVDGCRV